MQLVLCSSNDVSALWAYQGLRRKGLDDVRLISSEMLGYGLRWIHRVGSNGATVDITLADGQKIRDDSVDGVLNRLPAAPSDLLMVAPNDREYAVAEYTAFFMSWLYALPGPVLNRPTPQGLSGWWRHISEWASLASRAGLPTPVYRQSSYDHIYGPSEKCTQSGGMSLFSAGTSTKNVIVVGNNVTGDQAPQNIIEGSQRLSELSGTELLGIEYVISPSNIWEFSAATPLPDLRKGGEMLLDALASAFKRG